MERRDADQTEWVMPLRSGIVRSRQPHAGSLPALLLLDLPQAAGRRRLRDQSGRHPNCEISSGERRFCRKCGSALWLYDPTWPDLVHPFASAIDSDLPVPKSSVHLMLKYKANWVEPDIRKGDKAFDLYPEESIADWHRRHGEWID